MKELFASQLFGLIGLLLFVVLFSGVLIWIFKPGAKEELKKHGEIPLKDGQHER